MTRGALKALDNYVQANLPGARIQKCCESRCTLRLDDLRPFILLKGEKVRPQQRMCDCIVFLERDSLIMAMAELKSGTVDVSQVVEKLRNGSRAAIAIVHAASGTQRDIGACFVVLARRWHRSEHKLLTHKSNRIRVEGTKHPILPRRCGTRLSGLLEP